MKIFFFKCFKRTAGILLLGIAFAGLESVSVAGVLLTKSNQAEIGAITENGPHLSIQTSYGPVDYSKDNLLWYATESEVDSLYKAAQKAQASGHSQAALLLYEASIAKEAATKSQAQSEWEALKKTVPSAEAAQTSTPPSESAAAVANSSIAPSSNPDSSASADLAASDSKASAQAAGSKDSKSEKSDRVEIPTGLKSKVNPIVAGIFAVVVLAILWQITMSEPEK